MSEITAKDAKELAEKAHAVLSHTTRWREEIGNIYIKIKEKATAGYMELYWEFDDEITTLDANNIIEKLRDSGYFVRFDNKIPMQEDENLKIFIDWHHVKSESSSSSSTGSSAT